MAQDYNSTINLPQTEFSMRGNLTQKEPAMLENWEKDRTYYEMIKKNEGKPRFILHDGPPYANGDIHTGTSLPDPLIAARKACGNVFPHGKGKEPEILEHYAKKPAVFLLVILTDIHTV